MGFKEAKRKVIDSLKKGNIRHETRYNIDTKNLYSIGAVKTQQLIEVISKARGTNYKSSPHDFDKSIEVHIISMRGEKNWYIKWYFSDPNTIFISVHE